MVAIDPARTPHVPWQPLAGLRLRHAALSALLLAGRPLTVPQILQALSDRGHTVAADYPNKALADALAVEVRRGRVVRVRRGLYAPGTIPHTTAWRLRHGSPHLRS